MKCRHIIQCIMFAQTTPPPARSLRSLAYYAHIISRGARSLNIMMSDMMKHDVGQGNIHHFHRRLLANHNDECNLKTALKARCYRLAPLLFGGNHILVIFALKYESETLFFFGAPNAKFSLSWEGGYPHLRSLRSLAVLLADYFWRQGNI